MQLANVQMDGKEESDEDGEIREEVDAGVAKDGALVDDNDTDIASSGPSSPVVTPEDSSRTNHVENTVSNVANPDTEVTPLILESGESAITPDQLYQAKVVVLDLLGWGVPPEYLLDRGISLRLLYTVFTELRLRLPESMAADCAAVMKGPKEG
ncbi:hypothetical protein BD410DRAFT_844571 [Rickenella mellea]|uniref:Uncharacterized protein n=1 Tax=Rickenella mellea TaxID=50990 RepID=A0A4Y7PMJ9_9AGAM|nr:hypothetical protein BD410DRAFT_844571 [Rickenella mellea]